MSGLMHGMSSPDMTASLLQIFCSSWNIDVRAQISSNLNSFIKISKHHLLSLNTVFRYTDVTVPIVA